MRRIKNTVIGTEDQLQEHKHDMCYILHVLSQTGLTFLIYIF